LTGDSLTGIVGLSEKGEKKQKRKKLQNPPEWFKKIGALPHPTLKISVARPCWPCCTKNTEKQHRGRTMLVTTRKDINVPKKYSRSFEVPGGLTGEGLKKKIGPYDWIYLDLHGANLQRIDLKCANLWCANLRHANLRHADLRRVDFTDADLRHADFTDADLRHANLRHADLTDAKNVDFSGTTFTCCAKHERIILIPEIVFDDKPIAAIMPEGKQPLLISVGCMTHTPDEWLAFTEDDLENMDDHAPEWHEAHMEAAIKKSRELDAEWRKKC
jgi:hypothetical protein